jgi:hypothetical protein
MGILNITHVIIIVTWTTERSSSSPGRIKNFPFTTSPRLGLRPCQPPAQREPGINLLGREADHSFATSAEVEKMLMYKYIHPPPPQYVFMAQ